MCGFVAVVDAAGRDCADELRCATQLLAHRGPDDESYYLSPHFAAGFRRLKIIDLSDDARQPMADESGRYRLVFNGEIYNYRELRRELQQRGRTFRTKSDSEVLLASYIEWGPGCLQKLNGMFSFLVWDQRERRLFGARDRFGEKPLYYAREGERLIFASEIKSIIHLLGAVPAANERIIRRYLQNGRSDTDEETFFHGIRSIRPAHCFEVRDGRFSSEWQYWRLSEGRPASDDSVGEFRELFRDSIRLRMRSDVPVGACLSGGLDSGSIVCMIPHVVEAFEGGGTLKTFTAAYRDFDERREVAEVNRASGASGCSTVPEPDSLEDLAKLLWYHDEPFHSFMPFASYRIMRTAREQGVAVLLNGQGADEVLAGYKKYFKYYLADLLRSGRLRSAWWSVRGASELTGQTTWPMVRSSLELILRRRLVPKGFGGGRLGRAKRSANAIAQFCFHPEFAAATDDALADEHAPAGRSFLKSKLLESQAVAHLPLYLRVEDRNSMANSIESRLPFLDHRLAELVFSMPEEHLMSGGRNKSVLRRAMQGVLPDAVLARKEKFGFPVPQNDWIFDRFRGEVLSLLESSDLAERGIFDARRLQAHYRRDAALPQEERRKADGFWFRVISLELWHRNWNSGTGGIEERVAPSVIEPQYS